jgi:hypothetical protein
MRTAWLAFCLLGAVGTVVLLEFPIAGILLLVLALGGIVARGPRGAAIAGLVTGIGGCWTALMARVWASCDAFNAVPGQSCASPGIEGWVVVGLAILAVGLVASIALVVRSRRA